MGVRNALLAMAALRILCSLLEMGAAFLMVRSGDIRSALRLNAALALVGPLTIVVASFVGLAGLASAEVLHFRELLMVVAGVLLVVLGTGHH